MVEEASALLETEINQVSELVYELSIGKLVLGIYYQADDASIGLKAALAKPSAELPSVVYDLMLNANATGVQLQGCKVGFDKSTNQAVLAQLLPSSIQEGEQLAQKILTFTQVSFFWQMTLTSAKDEEVSYTPNAANESMLSV